MRLRLCVRLLRHHQLGISHRAAAMTRDPRVALSGCSRMAANGQKNGWKRRLLDRSILDGIVGDVARLQSICIR